MNHSKTESCGTRRTQWREDATRCIGRREVRAGPREVRAGPREVRAGPREARAGPREARAGPL